MTVTGTEPFRVDGVCPAGRAAGRAIPGPDRAVPETVLLLTADTGGGHRAASEAIGQALDSHYSDRFVAAVCDPLTGPEAHRLLRRVCRWYGPLTRRVPWLWCVIFHVSNMPVTRWVLRRLVARWAVGPIVAALDRHQPAVMVALHPLTVDIAVAARDRCGRHLALATVVTDLATAHGTWWHARVDRTITSSARLLTAGRVAGAGNVHGVPLGIPVRAPFRGGSCGAADRAVLRARMGVRPGRFVVLVTAGAEGGRDLKGWTRAIIDRLPSVDVVTVCGRNEALCAELAVLAAGAAGGRLLVRGSVDDMADWVRCADLVVSKAGPSIIAESAAVGVPLLLPAHLPGQETGNADLAVAVGAARRVRGRRHLVRQIDALRTDAAALAAMRDAATRTGWSNAAIRIAELVVDEAGRSHDTTRARPTPQRKRTP